MLVRDARRPRPSATTRGWTASAAGIEHNNLVDPGDHEGHPLPHRRRLGLASRRRRPTTRRTSSRSASTPPTTCPTATSRSTWTRADDLADWLEDAARARWTEATTGMWKMMAGWTREQMIDAGLLVYYGVIKDLAHFAGVYEQDDWFTVDERVQRFKPLFNDEYGGHLIAEIVGLISHDVAELERVPHGAVLGRARRDVDADPVLGARRRRVDVDASGRCGRARTSLPAKTAPYTTTRGQAHARRRATTLAKEFQPVVVGPAPLRRRHVGQEPPGRPAGRGALPRRPDQLGDAARPRVRASPRRTSSRARRPAPGAEPTARSGPPAKRRRPGALRVGLDRDAAAGRARSSRRSRRGSRARRRRRRP